MSYYNEPSWPVASTARQPSWEQPHPPSRSGTGHSGYNGGGPPTHMDAATTTTSSNSVTTTSTTTTTITTRDEPTAFASQFDEVERAAENLAKSGKPFGPGFSPTPLVSSRRESMPVVGAGSGPRPPFPDYDQRIIGVQRHHSLSDYDGVRAHPASNAQGFYQNQRYAPRPNDADQMAQAKRRMAAQRERELRNYHQEQQYHRNVSGSKSDRSMSPNAMNEDERRELIARQHRALYGETSTLYNNNPTSSQDARVQTSQAGRGPSPLAFDHFGMQSQANPSSEAAAQIPSRSDKDATANGVAEARTNSNVSPSSNQNPAFALYDAQQARRASDSPPGASPPALGPKANNATGVAPIGTRPQIQNLHRPAATSLAKRTTSPLPSPLSYNAYNASEQTSSASGNASATVNEQSVGIWNNGPWSKASNQAVQASVWG